MLDKDLDPKTEKEMTRRCLLANMLCTTNAGQMMAQHNRWPGFWLRLFKKPKRF